MLELPVATTRCRQIPAIVIQHSRYFADLHGASISRTWFPRWTIQTCSITFALSGAPPRMFAKRAPLVGASDLERVVRHLNPIPQEHRQIRGWWRRTDLIHHVCNMAAMVGGVIDHVEQYIAATH